MILETIVTTLDAHGQANIAPMGVEWGERRLVLKPFLDTTTYRNVAATGVAVVNLVDDVRVFVRAALSTSDEATQAAVVVPGVRLDACCSWREVRVHAADHTTPRSRFEMDVVHRGVQKEFIGFCRASSAVLEATIHATRLHLLSRAFVESELERLQVIVDKTAGAAEHAAMAEVRAFVSGVFERQETS